MKKYLILFLIIFLDIISLSLFSTPSAQKEIKNVKVYYEKGMFGGWPANFGIWNWGNSFDPEVQKAVTENRKSLLNKGPRVTTLDPVTNETGILTLARFEDPASKAQWAPMFAEIINHMKKRGLEKAIMLGLMNDIQPNKTEVTFWNDVSKNAPWVSHGHVGAKDDVVIGNKGLLKIADIGYAAFVANLTYNVNIEKGRKYGWQNPGIMAAYVRGGVRNQWLAMDIREMPV